MNLESGTVVVSNINTYAGGENNIGHDGGVATLKISGGSLSVSDVLRFGNGSDGNGTLNKIWRRHQQNAAPASSSIDHVNGTGTRGAETAGRLVRTTNFTSATRMQRARGTYTDSVAQASSTWRSKSSWVGKPGRVSLNVDARALATTGNLQHVYWQLRPGTGTLNQTAGVISVIKEFGVGDAGRQ